MKKLITFLCVLTCVLGLTACGSQATYSDIELANISTAQTLADTSLELALSYGDEIAGYGLNKQEMAYLFENNVGYGAELGALEGLITTSKQMVSDMGAVVGKGTPTSEVSGDYIIVTIPLNGQICDGQAVFKFSNDIFTKFVEGDCQANTTFAMKMAKAGDNMGKAGLNTLLGMGTVFVMLILISFIIAGFKLLSNVGKKQPEVKAPVAAPAVVEEEELSDDTELVAVIMAAISAYEGNASTDGFVVRSIKRANRRF